MDSAGARMEDAESAVAESVAGGSADAVSAVAPWSLAGLAFAAFTAANLVPRALAHQRWYRETFPDFPAERKALLPYLL